MKQENNHEEIKKIIQEEFEYAPPPPLSKEENWYEIQRKLNGNKTRSFYNKKIIAAGILLTLISTILFSPQNASSFNWITSLFTNVQGTVTQIIGIQEEGPEPIHDEARTVPTAKIIDEDIRIVNLDINKAQEVASFDILIPDYLPEEFYLKDVTVELINDTISHKLILNYISANDTLIIRQEKMDDDFTFYYGFDNEDTELSEIEINGNQSNLLFFKDGSINLIMVIDNTQIIIDSTLDVEHIIEIAKSVN